MFTTSENPVPVPSDTPIPGLGPVVFAVFAAALAGLLFGYDTGVASGIQGYLQSYFHLSNTQLGFAIASLDLGCIAGAMMAGTLADRFGRKLLLTIGTAIQVVALASVGLVFPIAPKARAINIHDLLQFHGTFSNGRFAAVARLAHSPIILRQEA